MVLDVVLAVVAALYFAAALALALYGLNCYVAIALIARRRKAAEAGHRALIERFGDPLARAADLPTVVTQIPLFNELNVAARAMEAACRLRYPAGRHSVQVLDDSTDETRELVDRTAARLRRDGHDIEVVRRVGRAGFKAGALAAAMERTGADLVAIFDADFVPPEDFLLRTVPFFSEDPRLALVQARWGHLNRDRSLLTRAQAVGIDGHFMVEQAARAWNGLFMNFNGTAGVWRRQAIAEAGGWHCDTLTEDMDLSYRAQLAGWRMAYVPDVVVPAEIPEDVGAFKSQQFRWAKGSIQTARKLLPAVFRARAPLFAKVQAALHLTHYAVHPLMLALSVLALPVLLSFELALGREAYVVLGLGLLASMAAPSSLYVVSQRALAPGWARRILVLPALVAIGVGVALSNSRGVIEALVRRESDFVRTPKRGDREVKRYRDELSRPRPRPRPRAIPGQAVAELLLGLYCVASLAAYLAEGRYLIGPFLGVYAVGYLSVGLMTAAEGLGLSLGPPLRPRPADCGRRI
jgi:cellulose synthase/poly-beta-1,6-N-acetylglucosamine synthase-like glycosyltransferase